MAIAIRIAADPKSIAWHAVAGSHDSRRCATSTPNGEGSRYWKFMRRLREPAPVVTPNDTAHGSAIRIRKATSTLIILVAPAAWATAVATAERQAHDSVNAWTKKDRSSLLKHHSLLWKASFFVVEASFLAMDNTVPRGGSIVPCCGGIAFLCRKNDASTTNIAAHLPRRGRRGASRGAGLARPSDRSGSARASAATGAAGRALVSLPGYKMHPAAADGGLYGHVPARPNASRLISVNAVHWLT